MRSLPLKLIIITNYNERQVGQKAHAKKTKKEEKDEEVSTDIHTSRE